VGFRELINRCLGELREWTERSPEARSVPDEVYQRIARLLRDARRIGSPAELEERVRAIEALIQSEGPVSEGFLPSLEALHERVSEANLDTP
jgi:hypothetical protein